LRTNQPLTCKATFEIYPDFELNPTRNWKSKRSRQRSPTPTSTRRSRICARAAATFEVVTDRPAADDDYVNVITGARTRPRPPANPLKPRTREIHLGGKHTVAAFTENLRGAKVGEVKEFPVTYAAEYPQKTLAGKTFSYRVEVQSIKRK
jgi:trigger factor